jgi:hypothetical protein
VLRLRRGRDGVLLLLLLELLLPMTLRGRQRRQRVPRSGPQRG